MAAVDIQTRAPCGCIEHARIYCASVSVHILCIKLFYCDRTKCRAVVMAAVLRVGSGEPQELVHFRITQYTSLCRSVATHHTDDWQDTHVHTRCMFLVGGWVSEHNVTVFG